MKRRLPVVSILAAFCLLVGVSCVHELPEGDAEVRVTLHLQFDYEMPQYKIVDYTTRVGGAEYADGIYPYDTRYTVHIYKVNSAYESSLDIDKVPDYSFVFFSDDVADLAHDFTVSLPSSLWEVVVWTDFVEKGAQEAGFYSNGNLADITLTGAYRGNEDFRDAFRGAATVDLRDYHQNQLSADVEIQMDRPLAKYQFITVDRERFVEMYMNLLALRGQTATKADDIDLETFRIEFSYSGYLPSTFNAFKDRPVNSSVNVKFDSRMRVLDDGNVEIGLDYVLVGQNQTSVTLALTVYDADGMNLGTLQGIEVPLLRNHLTTVMGRFLTSGSSSGVAIDPSFDGEFNVYIH